MATLVETMVSAPEVADRDRWLAARMQLLQQEKRATRAHDELSELRRRLPRVKVEKPYRFQTPCGTHPLANLFGDKSQLLVYHFMFGPDASEGCPSCSMIADQLNALAPHVRRRDVSLVLVSRAPLEKLVAFKTRMGWDNLVWASSFGSDFNHDFGVTLTEAEMASGKAYNYGTQDLRIPEAPGLSAFVRENGQVYHTYSTYGRGLEGLLGVYGLLDLAPRGRDEDGILPHPMAWVRHHDAYGDDSPAAPAKPSCCH